MNILNKNTISKNIIDSLNIDITKPSKNLYESVNNDSIQVFMNTWNNYNEYGADEGNTPTGWMSIDDAIEYCKKYNEYEPFINDIDNCPIEVSEYDNASTKLEELKKIEDFDNKEVLYAALEASSDDIDTLMQKINDGDYIFFSGVEDEEELGRAYVDMVGFEDISDKSRYFDEDAYRNETETDERDYYAQEHGIDVDDEDFPEDEFEDWMDDLVNERSESGDFDERYFDYEALGRDLSFEGYHFTDTGAICILY